MNKKPFFKFTKRSLTLPPFLQKIIARLYDFLNWIAPAVEWVEDQAERYKAASDAVPPPSKHWVQKRHLSSRNMTVTVYMVFLTVMTVIALYLPNRPTYSELEQRNLTSFPKPTPVSVLNGEFFDRVNTWFADTFPMRESFLQFHSTMQGYYGFSGRKVVGEVATADEIPAMPKAVSAEDDAEQSASFAVTVPDTSSASEVSTTATPPKQDLTQWEDTETTQPEPAERTPAQEEPSDVPEQFSPAPAKEEQTEDSTRKTENDDTENDIEDDTEDDTEDGIEDSDIETLGALLVTKNAAYEYYNFVQSTADSYIDLINRAATKLDGKANVYDVIVPTSMDICVPKRIRKKVNTSNQEDAIHYLYGSMTAKVHTVDIMRTLQERESEGDYLYFRTDHHWTALGAYYAYQQYATAAGKRPASLDDFNEHIYEGFLGSFYRQTESSKLSNTPDTVYAYEPKTPTKITVHSSEGNVNDYDIIGNAEKMGASLKYLCFIAGDNPFSVMENPTITDGSAVLLVKESFGNCFAPYLTANYQYVYVADYRYINDIDSRHLKEIVEDYCINDVIFLNNIGATRDKNLVSQISKFVS